MLSKTGHRGQAKTGARLLVLIMKSSEVLAGQKAVTKHASWAYSFLWCLRAIGWIMF